MCDHRKATTFAHFEGCCPFLVCDKRRPHNHPVCPECGIIQAEGGTYRYAISDESGEMLLEAGRARKLLALLEASENLRAYMAESMREMPGRGAWFDALWHTWCKAIGEAQ